jgi:siroheme synthase (precorrin-2 oxidase/ferrochelatase)
MIVAISSSGAAPALTRLVREVIEQVLPADEWIRRAEELRAQWLRDSTPMADRFAQLVREIARGGD